MTSSLFNVTISSIAKAAPSDGFIDPFKTDYYRALANAPKGTSMDVMAVKKKGWVRWHRIEDQLQRLGNIYISNKAAPGADVNTPPTSVTFIATVEHGIDSLSTLDELNAGVTIVGADAIKRAIARALVSSLISSQDVWDPTTVTNTDVVSFGYRIIPLEVGPLATNIAEANSKITVTAI
jgi:hypothetical protein